jgi:hypothetical protein
LRFQKDLEARWEAQPTDDLYSLGVALYRCVTGVYLPPMSEGGELQVRKVPRPSGYCTLSLELEALILRLLSADRKQRGTAEALAREAAVLAEAPGESVDRPILPTASAVPTDPGGPSSDGLDDEEALSDTDEPTGPSSSTDSTRVGRRRRRQTRVPDWAAPALAALAGGFLVAGVMLLFILLSRASDPAPRWEASHQEAAPFAPDAGVGEEVLSSVQDVPQAVLPAILSLGRPMPTGPLQGQRRPPCPRGDREINGGCWVEVAREKPPCGDTMFDYDGACFKVSVDMPRQPTSEEP